MEPGFLDSLVDIFRAALTGSYERLSPTLQSLLRKMIGINLIFAAFAWIAAYTQLFTIAATQVLYVALYKMLLVSFPILALHFQEFVVWGALTAAGIPWDGGLTVAEFQKPSTIVVLAFEVTQPINAFIVKHTGIWELWNYFTLQPLSWAAGLIWFALVALAFYVTWVQIVMLVIIAYVVIMMIFAPIGPLAFMAQRGLGLLVSGSVRLGMCAFLVGLSFPLAESFASAGVLLTAKGNIDMRNVGMTLGGAFLFTLLVWSISSLVSGPFGSGPLWSWRTFVPGASLLTGSGSGSSGSGQGRSGPAPAPVAPQTQTAPSGGVYP